MLCCYCPYALLLLSVKLLSYINSSVFFHTITYKGIKGYRYLVYALKIIGFKNFAT